jgi:hypothetical protein
MGGVGFRESAAPGSQASPVRIRNRDGHCRHSARLDRDRLSEPFPFERAGRNVSETDTSLLPVSTAP